MNKGERNVSVIQKLVLFCLKSIENQRTAYAILHLLNGKKSSQTIQDAHLFHLKQYFHVLPHLAREEFNQILDHLLEEKYVTCLGEGSYRMTEKGDMYLQEFAEPIIPSYLNGWSYNRMDKLFWERLSLMVQVISNLVAYNGRYLPIQNNKPDIDWLKNFIQRNRINRHELATQLFKELQQILTNKKIDPLILILRLTGSNRIGLTQQQAAEQLQMSMLTYQLHFTNVIHMILTEVKENNTSYPLLEQILETEETNEWLQLTQSTRKTAIYLNQGYDIEDIIKIRKLKQGTIEDHIVELAIVDSSFNIDVYVPPEVQRNIIKTSTNGIKQLKYIRQSVPEASYFQIRLVLAKHKSAVSV